jgi:hypothetical protein
MTGGTGVGASAEAISGVLRRFARSPEARAAPAASAPFLAGLAGLAGFAAPRDAPAGFAAAREAPELDAPEVEAISRSSLQPTRG